MNKKRKILLGVLALAASAIASAAQSLLGSHSGYIAAANTYDSAVPTHASAVQRTNDAAVTARHLLWKKGATNAAVALCGAADVPIGTIDNIEAETGLLQAVLLLGRGSTKKVVASEAIAVGDEIFTAANGKVQNRPSASGTYYFIGIALTASGADNDIIEVNDTVPVRLVIA